MKASELIKELAELITEYGDSEVKICLLSENTDVEMKISSISEPTTPAKDDFLIEVDADSDWFKRRLQCLWKKEKDEKKRPVYDGCGEADYSDFSHVTNPIWLCPRCDEPLKEGQDCTECYQKIDWNFEK